VKIKKIRVVVMGLVKTPRNLVNKHEKAGPTLRQGPATVNHVRNPRSTFCVGCNLDMCQKTSIVTRRETAKVKRGKK